MQTKEQTLFWLKRRLRDLEDVGTPPTDSEMARMGLSYSERRNRLEQADEEWKLRESEIEAMTVAIALVEQHV